MDSGLIGLSVASIGDILWLW